MICLGSDIGSRLGAKVSVCTEASVRECPGNVSFSLHCFCPNNVHIATVLKHIFLCQTNDWISRFFIFLRIFHCIFKAGTVHKCMHLLSFISLLRADNLTWCPVVFLLGSVKIQQCLCVCIQVGFLAFTCASGAAAAVTHCSPQGCFLSHCDKLIFGKFTSVHRVCYVFTASNNTRAAVRGFIEPN